MARLKNISKLPIFGTDGIRGAVGRFPITPEFCLRLGWAAGKVFARQGSSHILIGKDTRISGYMLESVLEVGPGVRRGGRQPHGADADPGSGLPDPHPAGRCGHRHQRLPQSLR